MKHRLPGDPSPEADVARMLRVDHAGEYGAARIYAGQLAVLGRRETAPVLPRKGRAMHQLVSLSSPAARCQPFPQVREGRVKDAARGTISFGGRLCGR